MTVVPRYNFPVGTEITLLTRKTELKACSDEGYVVADAETGVVTVVTYAALVDYLRLPGFHIKKQLTNMSAKASLRLGGIERWEGLPSAEQEYGHFKHAICQAIHALLKQTREKLKDPEFTFSQRKLNDPEVREQIAEHASAYFGKRIFVHAPAGGNRLIWQLPKGRTLNDDFAKFLRLQDATEETILDTLVSLGHLKGNRTPRIPYRLRELMSQAFEELKREPINPSIANAHDILKTLVNEENLVRKNNDLPPLITPSAATLAKHHSQFMSPTEILIASKGERFAKNKLGGGSTDIRALLFAELVEMDECKASLVVSAKAKGIWERLSVDERAGLEDVDEYIKTRLTILVMIDVASRMPLAWIISDQPKAEATLALLRMATRDKTREKVIYGCLGDPTPAVGLGMVKNDNGPGLRNNLVKNALVGIGAISLDVRTYSPTDKPYIERMFGTTESVLFKIILGYTGRRAGDLPDYDARKNGVLFIEDLNEILTRFFVDEYPSMRHFGIGMFGRRPAEVYREINETRGHFDLLDPNQRRINLGWKVSATPTSEGVRALSALWFNSDALQSAIDEKDGYARVRGKVSVFIDPDDINRATVVLPRTNAPIEVDIQITAFADMTAAEVLRLIAEYRKEDPKTIEFHEGRLAQVRRSRSNRLMQIGVEARLQRSYVTQAEFATKANALMQGARYVKNRVLPQTVSAGQVTADRPDGRVYYLSNGTGVIELSASEASDTPDGAAAIPCDPADPPTAMSHEMTVDAQDPQPKIPRRSSTARKTADVPPAPTQFLGRPNTPKRLE